MVLGIGEGRIDIILEKTSFKPRDVIKGKVDLKLNAPKKARELRIVLIAEREVRRQGKKRKEVLHKVPIVLEREKEFTSGIYDFEIILPELAAAQVNVPSGFAGELVKAATMFVGGPSPVKWYLSAELDIPMSIDVKKTIQINVV